MNFKAIFKKIIPHLIAVAAMFIVSSVYFYPAWEGKTLQGTDVSMNYGKFRERNDFLKYEDQFTMWNGAMFSGMPEYISTRYKGAINLYYLWNIPGELGVPLEIVSLFWYMIGFYIMLLAFGVNPWIALLGSLAFGFTSYNLIIIEAGHYMKVHTLAFIPPTLGGIYLCLRRKYIWGFIITSFFLALQINMKHIQMIYYFMMVVIIIGLFEIYYFLKDKEVKPLFRSSAVLFFAALLAVSVNFSKLANLYKYSQHSIRGPSELTIGEDEVRTQTGLDKDYINAWSSGITESMMLFVPNVKGGITGMIKQDPDLMEKIPGRYRDILGNLNQYWGNQPFTGGPNYVGAVFVFLFLLGLFLIKDRIKRPLFFATILLIVLSWGGNFSFITDVFIDYIPLYNKFRAPVSILAIVAVIIPLMAVLAINKMANNRDLLKERRKVLFFKRPQWVFNIIGGFFLLFLLLNIAFPHLLNEFISDAEKNQFRSISQQQNAQAQINAIIQSLTDLRISVFRTELWRSFIFIGIAWLLIFLFTKKKINKRAFFISVLFIVIIDLIGVGLRYVNSDHFHKKEMVKADYQLDDLDKEIYYREMSQDEQIQKEFEAYKQEFEPESPEEETELLRHVVNKNTHYRVFNLTTSPFQETRTTYAHRSIGGYHAVKLKRYQNMIEHHISKNNMDVLNMLDTKYFITDQGVQVNPGALGAAWFIDSLQWVADADEEILALNDFNPSREAVIQEKYKDSVDSFSGKTSEDSIYMVRYNPDHMVYKSEASGERFAVFSEVFYPDWEAFVDGKKVTIYPVNYILRGIYIPEGEHTVEFVFNPEFYRISNQISQFAFYIFSLILLAAIGWWLWKRKQNTEISA